MSIDWTHFTPISALVGGAMIGLAAALLILGAGRILGAAGILARRARSARRRGGLALVADRRPGAGPEPRARPMGRGGADFHGGLALLARLRPARRIRRAVGLGLHQRPRRLRPVAAVAALVRRDRRCSWPPASRPSSSFATSWPENRSRAMRNGLALVVGLIFGLGLCLSGMSEPSKVLGFLDLAGAWDPSLAFVMGGAIAIAAPAFALARRRARRLARRRRRSADDARGSTRRWRSAR